MRGSGVIMIYGNTSGIKRVTLDILESLCETYDKHLFIDREALSTLTQITAKINRELCVFISRNGIILSVGIGDASTVALQNINLKRSETKFTGVRCIHTHPSGSGRLSEMDTSALQNLRLDCMAAIGVDRGDAIDIEVAYINRDTIDKLYFSKLENIDDSVLLGKIVDYEAISSKKVENENTEVKAKSAILVNVSMSNAEVEIAELKRLADTMGINVVEKVIQRQGVDRAFCAGRGKLDEIKQLVQINRAEFVIFNNQLTGSQLNNIEEVLGCKVIDRSMLILEIFAKHATTNEGKLQVELAMLKYTLPKLLGQGKALSRIGGSGASGSATRGAGETKLETDRRKIKRTIFELNNKIEELKKERDLRRERRLRSGIKTVAIVGYTNAGKSTLMNNITKAGVLEADKLFATLDPVTRKIFVDYKHEYLLTDTVGFIDNLPHEFIDAFRSTLEEATYADVLLHVADCSSSDLKRQEDVVLNVLSSLGIKDTPIITVYNKADLVENFTTDLKDSVVISAKQGTGINELRSLIIEKLFGDISVNYGEENKIDNTTI